MSSFAIRRISSISAAALGAALVVGLGATAAWASHFRASGPDFVVDGHVATWVVTTAWETNDADSFVGEGGTTEVLSIDSYADTPGEGTGTGVELEVISEVASDEPLYAQTVETFRGDLSSLGDGLYEVYIDNCCRVDDIENSIAEDFSQWVRFSKTGSTYAVAPRLGVPIIYAPLSITGVTTLVSYAAPGAASWSLVSDENYPYYGSGALPCSTFSGGALQVGAAHCTGGDVYTDIYTEGSYWAFKVQIADAAGRQSVAETLFRVESTPEPYIDRHVWLNGGARAQFWAYAPDVLVSSWVIECTNTSDAGDVVSGSATSLPITVNGFTGGEEYDCVASATNGAGTGSSDPGDYVITAPSLLLELQFSVGDFYAGKTAIVEGSGLDPYTDYSLVMYSDPLPLLEGETDGDGSFYEEVTVPEEACIPGRHELRLAGTAGDSPVTTSQWIEIDENCIVIEIRDSAWGDEELADTGAANAALPVGIAALITALGAALLIARRRGETTV